MKRLFTWKMFRRLLIGFAALITLVAVIWAVENFRGHRAWTKYKGELQANGEELDLQSFVPPPVPDEKNFALSSVFRNLSYAWEAASKGEAPVQPPAIDATLSDENHKAPSPNDLIDLDGYQEFYRGNTNYPQPARPQSAAEDVLVALSRFDEELSTLHKDAAERPHSRFPNRYEDGMRMLLPHLSSMRSIVRTMRLRGTAYLELDRNEEAFREAQLAFRMTDSIKEEPILISYLVRMAILRDDAMFVKEGILRHAWSEPQLQELQNYFSKTDLLSDYHAAIRGERAFALNLLDALGRGDYSVSELVDPAQTQSASMKWFLPIGWIKQNQRHISKMHQDITLPAVDSKARRVFPEIVVGGEAMLLKTKTKFPNPHDLFSRMLFPAVLNVSKRTAQHQTTVDQTMLGCALERYYLAKKAYPDSLQDLVPQFVASLPHDVITGGPIKYQRTANGFYKLYSLGWDSKDDGGHVAEEDRKSKDWVWQFPES